MAFLPPFGGAFQSPMATPAVAKWWLSGGIAAANCIAAYQPKGATSLAASYINLANPGTYNAAPGVAPTWASATGWTGNGTTQYLTTGIVPVNNQVWSAVVRFSGAVVLNDRALFGAFEGPPYFAIIPRGFGGASVAYDNGNIIGKAPILASGVLGFSGNAGYRNGIDDAATIPAVAGVFTRQIYLLAYNNAGVAGGFFNGSIQAMAFYNTSPTAPQMLALYTAMAAL